MVRRMYLLSFSALVAVMLISGCGGGGGGGGGGGSTTPVGPTAAMQSLDQATTQFCQAVQGGADPEQSATSIANALASDSTISDVEKGDGVITFKKSGNLAAMYYANLGSESDEDLGAQMAPMESMVVRAVPGVKKAVVFNSEPFIFNRTPARVKARLESLGYTVDYYESDQVTISRMANTGQYGVIYFSGHGGKGLWCTGQLWSADDPALLQMSNNQEIAVASIVKYDVEPLFTIYEKRWAITPEFVTNNINGLNDSIVLAYTCLTMQNLSMADAFTAKGAQVYCGWDCKVLMNFQGAMRTLIDLMAGGATLDDAVAQVGDSHLLYHYGDGDSDARLTDQPKSIAASEPGYDDIGAILTGLGYTVTTIGIDGLSSGGLSGYSNYAANCSGDTSYPSAGAVEEVRSFVEAGGRLYCSDWAYAIIQGAFPDKLTFYDNPKCGSTCSSTASVTDPTLRAFLGRDSLPIEFDLGSWVPIKSVGAGVTVLLSGDYEYYESYYATYLEPVTTRHATTRSGGTRSAGSGPIAVSFNYGSGKVVYTSFHLHAQETGTANALMEYLALL